MREKGIGNVWPMLFIYKSSSWWIIAYTVHEIAVHIDKVVVASNG